MDFRVVSEEFFDSIVSIVNTLSVQTIRWESSRTYRRRSFFTIRAKIETKKKSRSRTTRSIDSSESDDRYDWKLKTWEKIYLPANNRLCNVVRFGDEVRCNRQIPNDTKLRAGVNEFRVRSDPNLFDYRLGLVAR